MFVKTIILLFFLTNKMLGLYLLQSVKNMNKIEIPGSTFTIYVMTLRAV